MTTKPPKTLGKAGRALWDRLQSEFEIEPGLEPALTKLCEVEDRLSEIRAALSVQGLTRPDGRANDLLAAEVRGWGQWRQLARALGVFDAEPARQPARIGRPPKYGGK
jgi:hypothetical protein